MKKYFIALIAGLMLITTVSANNKMKLVINNMVFENQEFIVKNNRIHAPLRLVAENTGAKVLWHERDKEVEIIKNNTYIKMKINSESAEINNSIHKMDTAPFINNNRSYVPIRFICNALNTKLNWDEKTLTAHIETGFTKNPERKYDESADEKELTTIKNIRKITDLDNYLKNGSLMVEDLPEQKVFNLSIDNYDPNKLSMNFIFDKDSGSLRFYRFYYLPCEEYPFRDVELSKRESRIVAAKFLETIGSKGNFLPENKLDKYDKAATDPGVYYFYTKDKEIVSVDALNGFVFCYSK